MNDTNEMKPENEATPETVTAETAAPVSTKRFSNKSMMALGFLALATVVGGAAVAKNRHGGDMDRGMMGGPAMNIDTMDADKSGDISFEEFSKAAGDRFILADTNKDGKVTVEEMAAAIEKMRAENMAKRMIEKFDANGDGALTQEEITTGQKKIFALMDKNNDGKVVKDEMPRHGKKGHHGGMGDGPDGPDNMQ